jgi:hypothetical protein
MNDADRSQVRMKQPSQDPAYTGLEGAKYLSLEQQLHKLIGKACADAAVAAWIRKGLRNGGIADCAMLESMIRAAKGDRNHPDFELCSKYLRLANSLTKFERIGSTIAAAEVRAAAAAKKKIGTTTERSLFNLTGMAKVRAYFAAAAAKKKSNQPHHR